MKTFLPLVLILTPLLAQSADQARHDETGNILAWLKHLASELSAVRRELHELRIEKQEARVQAHERELQQIRDERGDREEQERMQAQELARIDQQLRAPTLTDEERAQFETLRAELLARKPSGPADSVRREAQAAERLEHEQRRLQKLKELAHALASR